MSSEPVTNASGPAGPAAAVGEATAMSTVLAAVLMADADRHQRPVALKAADTGQYVRSNAAFAALAGRPIDEIAGRNDAALFGAPLAASFKAADDLALASSPQPVHSEHRFEREGRRCAFAVTRIAVAEAAGGAPGWIGAVWHDLSTGEDREAAFRRALAQLESEQREQMARRRLAATNAAGAEAVGPNASRATPFEDQLRREVDLSVREQREFSLVLLELDPLAVPEGLDAPHARERALDALDRLMLANIRAMDATSRLAEDRFAVLLSGVGLATAHARIEGLRRQCATQLLALGGRELGFSISVGIASFPHTTPSRDELVRCATEALRDAQSRGGNQVKLAGIRFEGE